MNELDALAQLAELVETISKNNWNHLYSKLEIPITPRDIALSKQVEKLSTEKTELQKTNAVLQSKMNTVKKFINDEI